MSQTTECRFWCVDCTGAACSRQKDRAVEFFDFTSAAANFKNDFKQATRAQQDKMAHPTIGCTCERSR